MDTSIELEVKAEPRPSAFSSPMIGLPRTVLNISTLMVSPAVLDRSVTRTIGMSGLVWPFILASASDCLGAAPVMFREKPGARMVCANRAAPKSLRANGDPAGT